MTFTIKATFICARQYLKSSPIHYRTTDELRRDGEELATGQEAQDGVWDVAQPDSG